MTHPTDWSRLREIAEDRRDGTSARLAEAVAQRDTARQKLEMLVDYRSDYDSRLAHSATGGIDAEKLRSYRQFLVNLQRAIDQQTEVLVQAQQRVAQAQVLWRAEQRQVDSFRILDERRVATETREASRREQKLTDELATRAPAPVAGGDD
jgi:flagellar protein FliJ